MLRRVGVAISVGLADSLNPSTVGPALYIATGRHQVWRVTQFTVGVFSVSFVGGVVLTIGPGRLLLGLVPHPRGTVRHVIELVVGVVLLVLPARAIEPRGPEANGSGPSATGAGAAPEGVEIRQFFGRMNDASVRQCASPTPWHPIRPPSSRLERRPYSAGHAGVCASSLAAALAPSRETLVIHDSLWIGGVARGLA